MVGMKGIDPKQRRKIRMRNHIAKDLGTPKYRNRIKDTKRSYMINELREEELDEEIEDFLFDGETDEYEFMKDLGLTGRE